MCVNTRTSLKPVGFLQEVPKVESIPLQPPNYFAQAYSLAENQEDNRLAKASVIRAPKDLE